MDRSGDAYGRRRRGRCVALLAIGAAFLIAGPPPARPGVSATPPPDVVPTEASGVPAPRLSIDPATWWLESGGSETLLATWSSGPPDCSRTPLWFRWSVVAGGAEGILGPTGAAAANFSARGVVSGTTVVRVESAVAIDCGGNLTSAVGIANATVSVDAPLAVVGFHSVLGGSPRNGTLAVAGTIVGGVPPYDLIVLWGTGAATDAQRRAAGNFTVWGDPGNGNVDPHLLVSDADGLSARAAAEENGTASGPFAVTIDPVAYTAEVGVPLAFRLLATEPVAAYSYLLACESVAAAVRTVPETASTGLTCTFDRPGVAIVSVVAVTIAAPYRIATAQLVEPVAPPLSIRLDSNASPAEVGRSTFVPVTLLGGVPPFQLSWAIVGNGSRSSEVVRSDGTVLVPVAPAEPGAEQLEATASDALGIAAENASAEVAAVPLLESSVDAVARAGSNGTLLSVEGTALAGATPYDWAVETETAYDGDLPGGAGPIGGSFSWNGTVGAEGTQNVTVALVDALGATSTVRLAAQGIPSLRARVQAEPGGPGAVALAIGISGGVPPFFVRVHDSGGGARNGTVGAGRAWNLTVGDPSGGATEIDVVVTDRLGAIARASTEIARVPAAPLPTADGESGAVAALAAVGGGAAAIVLWRRRRRSAPAPDPIDAVAVLRGIIAPADGVDRGVVELLAEEQGVPLAEVRATLDRLIAHGTVRAERGSDGEEILAWRWEG